MSVHGAGERNTPVCVFYTSKFSETSSRKPGVPSTEIIAAFGMFAQGRNLTSLKIRKGEKHAQNQNKAQRGAEKCGYDFAWRKTVHNCASKRSRTGRNNEHSYTGSSTISGARSFITFNA